MDNIMIGDDKLVKAISEFKKSLVGQTISIHGKDYATVALRVGVARRVLGSSLNIISEVISIDKDTVVMKAIVEIDGNKISTGYAEDTLGV